MISLKVSSAAEDLRGELIQWLEKNPPPQINQRIDLEEFVGLATSWQRKLAADRWIAVHWPESFGGRGLSIVEEAVVQEVLANYNAPQMIGLFGLTMVGPVLIEHGTEEQKKRFLSKILLAEEIWCQGFSEPEAGSDLAALNTSAEKVEVDGEEFWEISGQKVWTSFAQYADWCFVLVRTSREDKKHRGLSYLLVPMDSPGLEIRPLTQISGDSEFNELFFDKVRVPVTNIVGKVGDGWRIAISTLMYERVVLTFARHLQSENVLHFIGGFLASQKDPKQADIERYGRLLAKSSAVRALALSHLLTYKDGKNPGPEGSMDKLAWSETFQEICKFALEIQGAKGVLSEGPSSVGDGFAQFQYLYSRGRTIAAGTSEIQRNIIAERVLELPRLR